MALYRQLQLSFWNDGFVMDLTPEEKFFYIYLLQCSNTKQCGIFELPKRAIEYETGYNRETIDKLLERFINYKKIEYCEETKEIMILNWIKYNFINSRNTIMCINKELKEVKNVEFVDKLYNQCEKLGYPMEEIFKDIHVISNKTRGLEGAYKPLGEEEIKEEIKIKIEEEEEIKKEVKEVEEVEEVEEAEEIVSNNSDTIEFLDADETIEMFNNINTITPIKIKSIRDFSKEIKFNLKVLILALVYTHIRGG